VEIIPEIDAPAHSLAFTHYRPDLASKEYGMDHFDLGNPDVYTFMDALFKEYLEPSPAAAGKEKGLPVFRGPRVCIGTDEYSNAKQEVVEQFRTYTDHYLALVESYGKQPSLWGALTHARGTTPVRHEGVLMNCWYNGYAEPDSMRQLGYQLVSIPDGLVYIVPKAGYYNEFLNCEYLYDNWTPAMIGNKHFAEQDPQIEGGMFALWNDIPDPSITIDDLHERIVPAMQTIAAKTWTGRLVSLPYKEFEKLCKSLR
jgi:hexosaminidase